MSILAREIAKAKPIAAPLDLENWDRDAYEQRFVNRIVEIVKSTADDDAATREIFDFMCDVDERSHVVFDLLYSRCKWYLSVIVTSIRLDKPFTSTMIELLRRQIIDTAIVIHQYAQKTGVRSIHHGALEDLSYLLSYVDTAVVVRVRTGIVTIPTRFNEEQLSENDIENNLLSDMIGFVRHSKDSKRLKIAFYHDTFGLSYKYQKLGWSDSRIEEHVSTLIEKLSDERSAVDIVRGRSALFRDNTALHSRTRNNVPERGYGVWIGERVVKRLMTLNTRSRKVIENHGLRAEDVMAIFLLEESEHYLHPPIPHGRLNQNPGHGFGEVIEHNTGMLRLVRIIAREGIRDILRENPAINGHLRLIPRAQVGEMLNSWKRRDFSVEDIEVPPGKVRANESIYRKLEELASTGRDVDKNIKAEDLFKIIINVDDMETIDPRLFFKKLLGHLRASVGILRIFIDKSTGKFKENYVGKVEKKLQEMRKLITQAASDILLAEEPGNRTMGDVLLRINYIDREWVARVNHNNTVHVVNRLDQPWKMSPVEQHDLHLDDLVRFTAQARDRELLKRIFDEKFTARYESIELGQRWIREDKNALVHIIMDEMSIDIIRGRASFCSGLYAMHPRCGSGGRDPGIWIGELTLRALRESGKEGREFFAQLMLEEAQHIWAYRFGVEYVHHGKYSGNPNNYGIIVEHDEIFLAKLENLTKDIELLIRTRSKELADREVEFLREMYNGELDPELESKTRKTIEDGGMSELDLAEAHLHKRIKEYKQKNAV